MIRDIFKVEVHVLLFYAFPLCKNSEIRLGNFPKLYLVINYEGFPKQMDIPRQLKTQLIVKHRIVYKKIL